MAIETAAESLLMTAGKALATATPIAMLVAVLVAYIRGRPEMRRIKQEGDAAFSARMMARVEDLERRLAKTEADLQVTRHQLNNERQGTDMLIVLVKSYLKRSGAEAENELYDIIERVEEYRAKQAQAVATEKGAIAGAVIKRTGDDN